MKKLVTVLSAILISVLAFVSTFCAFAQETSSDNSTPPPQTELTAQNTVVTLSKDSFVYSGKAFEPTVEVKYNSSLLSNESDYIVEYSRNTNAGVANVSVEGKNQYSGSITKSFIILPSAVGDFTASKKDYYSLTFTWKALPGANGYDLALYDSAKKSYVHYDVDGAKTKYTLKKLKSDTSYKVKLRAYINVDSQKKYGAYTKAASFKTKAVVKAPTVSGYSTLKAKPVVTWKKIKGAEKYAVYRSTKKKGTYKKIATVSSSKKSYTDKKAKAHKTYYYKVKSAKTIKKSFEYSKFSNAVAIKTKKTVIVGDSILEGLKVYKTVPGVPLVTKVGMGTYTFYNNNYFKVGKSTVPGIEKVISYKPDRIFIMLGMNEIAYKKNAAVFEYYKYSVEDLKEELPGVEIVLLPVSPTKASSGKSVPKKKRINSFNKELKKFAKENGCSYYDYTADFKDGNGYLKSGLDSGDGCHWKPSTCKMFIGKINKYIKKNK